MGFVQNYNGLMTARFFLGMTEAGMKPGTLSTIQEKKNTRLTTLCRSNLLHVEMVPPRGASIQSWTILFCYRGCWRFQRTPGVCHQLHE